jgi:hypothetical protein
MMLDVRLAAKCISGVMYFSLLAGGGFLQRLARDRGVPVEGAALG